MSENPVAADPWGLPVEAPDESDLQTAGDPSPSVEPSADTSDRSHTAAPDAADGDAATAGMNGAAPNSGPSETPTNPSMAAPAEAAAAPTQPAEAPTAAPEVGATVAMPEGQVDTIDDHEPDLFPGDNPADQPVDNVADASAAGLNTAPASSTPAFDTSTEQLDATFENYELALPSTPEPRVEISTPADAAGEVATPGPDLANPDVADPDPTAPGTDGPADAGLNAPAVELPAPDPGVPTTDTTDLTPDGDDTSPPGAPAFEISDDQFDDGDLASIADELSSSLSGDLAGSGDVELGGPDAQLDDGSGFDIDTPTDDSSVLAAISSLEPAGHVADEPDDGLEEPISDLADAQGGPGEPLAPSSFSFSLDAAPTTAPDPGAVPADDTPADEMPAPTADPMPSAWASGLGGGSSLFGDPTPSVAAPPPEGEPDAGVVDADPSPEPSPHVTNPDPDPTGLSPSPAAPDLQPLAGQVPPADDIPDDMPSWAVDYDGARLESTPAAGRSAGGDAALPANGLADSADAGSDSTATAEASDPDTGGSGSTELADESDLPDAGAQQEASTVEVSLADESKVDDLSTDDEATTEPAESATPADVAPASGPTPHDPWAPPVDSGLDRPYTSQPVPSAYKELENLPPPLVTGREPATDEPAAEDQPASGGMPEANDARLHEQPEPQSDTETQHEAGLHEAALDDTVPQGESVHQDETVFDHETVQQDETVWDHQTVQQDETVSETETPTQELGSPQDQAEMQPQQPATVEPAADVGAVSTDGALAIEEPPNETPDLAELGSALFPGDETQHVAADVEAPAADQASDVSDLSWPTTPDTPILGEAMDVETPAAPDEPDMAITGVDSADDATLDQRVEASEPIGLFASNAGDLEPRASDADSVSAGGGPNEDADPHSGSGLDFDLGFAGFGLDDTPTTSVGQPMEEQSDSATKPQTNGAKPGNSNWASKWAESAQGWVVGSDGETTWRPIITTAQTLDGWDAETYLGLVCGEAVVADDLSAGRTSALARMVEEGLARGAHALIGVNVSYHSVAERQVAVAMGTAVTLTPDD